MLNFNSLKWFISILAAFNYGFMLFDGSRALILGDYLRPESGEYAGQLGPWSDLVSAIGIHPESTLMKVIFVAYGLVGLITVFRFISNAHKMKKAMLILSIASSWYLVPGTILSILQVIFLAMIKKN